MKILHIASSDSGGAGKGMINLHLGLIDHGIDSKVLVADKTTNLDSIYVARPNINIEKKYNFIITRIIKKIFRHFNIGLSKYEKLRNKINIIQKKHPCFYTMPITQYDISNHPLVLEADVIHLHWVSNFVDYTSFFQKVKKPIIWTLRDENPGLGGFHYSYQKDDYYRYYRTIEDYFCKIKSCSLTNASNLSLIAFSNAMEDFISSVSWLKHHTIFKIYNLVNPQHFNIIEHTDAKKILGIDQDTFVIGFVSVYLKDPRKGYNSVCEAVKKLNKKYTILCAGEDSSYCDNEERNRISLGAIHHDKLLSIVYNASDIFVSPSLQESFGKTIIESLFCGTPVICSKTGIANEIISQKNGILLESNTVHCLEKAITDSLSTNYNREEIRRGALEALNPDSIINEHISLYNNISNTFHSPTQ